MVDKVNVKKVRKLRVNFLYNYRKCCTYMDKYAIMNLYMRGRKYAHKCMDYDKPMKG